MDLLLIYPVAFYANKFGGVVKSAIIHYLIPKTLVGKILCCWDGTNIFIFKVLERNLSWVICKQ
jgi:hypothetical protein